VDFSFSEDQESIRELARKILEERVTPERLKELEATPDVFDRDTWRALADANLLGVAIPEAHGGMGMGLVELGLLLEEVGRTVAPLPVHATLVAGALPVARFGTRAQQEALLPRVARGECVLTAALIEPGSVDPDRVDTLAARSPGGGYRLTGRKTCVPALHLAERVLVPARLEDGSVGIFLLAPGAPGVRAERQHATSHEPQFLLTLEDVAVTADDRLGGDAAPAGLLPWLVTHATAGLCALELGVAERALRLTADYCAKREQFGQPIGSFQAVHQRVADAYIDVECIRWTTWRALWRLSAGEDAGEDVSIAKFWAGEGGHRVTYAAQHLHGGIGVDVDYRIHRHYLWSRQIEVTLGTSREHAARVACGPPHD